MTSVVRQCQGEGCAQPAKMQCPTCVKSGLESTFFCTQDCFKKNWPTHKVKHIILNTNPWPGFKYSGKLRPFYPLSPRRPVPDSIPKPDYALDGIPKSEQKIKQSSVITPITDPAEVLTLRKACALGRLVLDTAAAALRPGITTDEIDAIVHETTIKYGGYPSPLNYHGFLKSCCTSVNEVICHGIPDRRPLQAGDIVNLDISVFYEGFHGDLNETYFVGEVDEGAKKLVSTAKECLDEAIKMCKPGVRYRDLGDTIEKIARKNGLSVVRTYGGHGIHKLFHCIPNVPHYAKNKAVGIMRSGHTFTIEPMINEGAWQDMHWPDDWTATTIDGKRSAQFEHTLLVTETGVEILTEPGVDKIYFPQAHADANQD